MLPRLVLVVLLALAAAAPAARAEPVLVVGDGTATTPRSLPTR